MAHGINTARPPRLEMIGIKKRFGATVAIENVSISVEPGQVLALIGENGAGKSTLMRVLSGAITPDSGSMLLDSKPYRPANPLDARKAGIAMIYQELSLADHLTVEENIMLGMEPCTFGFVNRKQVRRQALEAIKFFNHPEIAPDIPVRKLSIAAKQLVEIARAIALGSKVLVLDEPTSSLAKQDVARLFELIAHLKSQGQSIIYISHFIEEVKQLADKITVLRDGKSVAASPAPDLDTDKIIELMIGRTVDDLYPHSHRSPGDAVLEIKNLRGLTKPVDASLTLRRGEVLGIAGLVGTGRTELLRSIFGLDKIKTGSIRIGVYGGPASPADRWSQGIGLLSENRKEEGLALNLSIAENVTLSKLGILGRLGFISPSRQAEAVKNWISCLEIKCLGPWQKASDLSGGNQQKVAFARLLQHDVDILLLDEPTRGIDVAAKAAIYKIIDDLACGCEKSLRPPKAVIVVSSYLPELMGICDRIAVMCRGVLGPARPVNQVTEHMLMLEAVGKGAK